MDLHPNMKESNSSELRFTLITVNRLHHISYKDFLDNCGLYCASIDRREHEAELI